MLKYVLNFILLTTVFVYIHRIIASDQFSKMKYNEVSLYSGLSDKDRKKYLQSFDSSIFHDDNNKKSWLSYMGFYNNYDIKERKFIFTLFCHDKNIEKLTWKEYFLPQDFPPQSLEECYAAKKEKYHNITRTDFRFEYFSHQFFIKNNIKYIAIGITDNDKYNREAMSWETWRDHFKKINFHIYEICANDNILHYIKSYNQDVPHDCLSRYPLFLHHKANQFYSDQTVIQLISNDRINLITQELFSGKIAQSIIFKFSFQYIYITPNIIIKSTPNIAIQHNAPYYFIHTTEDRINTVTIYKNNKLLHKSPKINAYCILFNDSNFTIEDTYFENAHHEHHSASKFKQYFTGPDKLLSTRLYYELRKPYIGYCIINHNRKNTYKAKIFLPEEVSKEGYIKYPGGMFVAKTKNNQQHIIYCKNAYGLHFIPMKKEEIYYTTHYTIPEDWDIDNTSITSKSLNNCHFFFKKNGKIYILGNFMEGKNLQKVTIEEKQITNNTHELKKFITKELKRRSLLFQIPFLLKNYIQKFKSLCRKRKKLS